VNICVYRNYPIALNPDAGCLASQGAKDSDQHYEDLCRATRTIRMELVPQLVELLIQRDFEINPLPLAEGYGLGYFIVGLFLLSL
jgi:hypothetical protein